MRSLQNAIPISRCAVGIGAFLVLTTTAYADHNIYLETPNTVPSYCQETNIACGAASAQMILEGYPGGVEHTFTQAYIWSRIQAHKDDPGINWATDPDGLRDTLMELGGDPGVYWNIFTDNDPQDLMYSVVYWMTRVRFPTAALVYGFQHWIVIDGFTTDVDPTQNTAVTLEFIEIVDPSNSPCPTATSGGVRILMTGANWYANYWYAPGNHPASKWDGNYVAVIEPPPAPGAAKAGELPEEGKIISADAARDHALRAFKKLRLNCRDPYRILRNSKPLQPLLINPKHKGYYIVPLGYEEGAISQGAVVVNAYDGSFQEVGVFERPIKYLAEKRAVRRAMKYLCLCQEARERVQAELTFQPSEQTQSRFLPVWAVTVAGRTIFVTQEAVVFEELTPLPLGD